DLKNFYMHGAGHWIGLDVHDVGSRKINDTWRPLEPGMTFTVEPGAYIEELGIGIRIEDDILVTPTGCEVLSAALPKTVNDIEAIMGNR
ncbi:MAG: M24 family metallopeptidase, partial [Gammaproteobacteria bacterium]